jgi:hypothetical protein
VRLAVIIALSILLEGCSSLPPILQRWGGLEIATLMLLPEDPKVGESFDFHQDGLVGVGGKDSDVSWRVRGEWLEIDTNNDGRFQTRMRAITIMPERIVTESPAGKKSVWRKTSTRIVIRMERPKPPGVWLP